MRLVCQVTAIIHALAQYYSQTTGGNRHAFTDQRIRTESNICRRIANRHCLDGRRFRPDHPSAGLCRCGCDRICPDHDTVYPCTAFRNGIYR